MSDQQFQSDKIHSTFWWEMKLDHDHPENYNRKVNTITGYSKREGHDEARDKAELFMKKIIMLYTRGYFDKSHSIVFYMREGEFLNKVTSRPLVKLTKKDYIIHTAVITDTNFHKEFFMKRGINQFLVKFYDCLSSGQDVKYLLPNKRPTFSKDDYLDPSKHDFKTRKHLYAYCEKMIKNGHPYEAVMHFQRKYQEKTGWN